MSISDLIVKLGGVLLFLVGLFMVLTSVGMIIIPLSIGAPIVSFFVGLVLMGIGIFVLRGGNITL